VINLSRSEEWGELQIDDQAAGRKGDQNRSTRVPSDKITDGGWSVSPSEDALRSPGEKGKLKKEESETSSPRGPESGSKGREVENQWENAHGENDN